MKNRVNEFRRLRGWTQKQLAEAAQTSQQQIQRIESGTQTARIHLALRICEALGKPDRLGVVFPDVVPALATAKRKKLDSNDVAADEELSAKFAEGGIDADADLHSVQFMLRNGHQGEFVISSRDSKRLWEAVRNELGGYITFQSEALLVGLSLDHLIYSHYLFESMDPVGEKKEDTPQGELIVYTTASREPLKFEIDPDEEDRDAIEPGDETEGAQLQDLFSDLNFSGEVDTLSFMDANGEDVLLKLKEVMLLTVPLWTVRPDLRESLFEETDDLPGPTSEADICTLR